ncbi:integrase core domain-containing protein, partial [Acidipropionibacterium jensenii]|uniref:integrase core domain-containing protein n=1 Tax=Acidipropionibacterium jensenii TaxID=1749 RepID=UPI0026483753
YSRMIVGWQPSIRMFSDFALDALDMGFGARRRAGHEAARLIQHSDRAVRHSERLATTGAVASVGATGDSYENAMAEALNSLYKTELVGPKAPWDGAADIEAATAEWVDWFNHQRLHSMLIYWLFTLGVGAGRGRRR